MSADRPFLDTNILVYAYDADAPEAKRSIAQALLTSAVRDCSAVLSAQVIGEFIVVVTRKLQRPLSLNAAHDIAELLSSLITVDLDALTCRMAMAMQRQYSLSWWDALILASAEAAGCTQVLSEDMADGQVYGRVTVRNPFCPP